MRLSEGLAGLVAEQVKPVIVEDAFRMRFKYFPEAGEEAYRSFFGVLVDRGLLQGVIVVQTTASRSFEDEAGC
jgi:signal transduction protein with GAF and PtsI domain